MYNNFLQTKIEDIVKNLYTTHDVVSKQMVLYSMYNQLRPYFIAVDKDNKAQLYNAYELRVKDNNGKLEIENVCDAYPIYQEYFIKKFTDNVDYGVYIDEEEVGHYFTEYGEVQVFNNYIQISSCAREEAEKLVEYVQRIPQEADKTVEYNLVMQTSNGFGTTECTSSRNIDVDVDKNYNDDLPYDKYKEFCEKDGSGLALMYGVAGSGKI